jgi:hypothetical protein
MSRRLFPGSAIPGVAKVSPNEGDRHSSQTLPATLARRCPREAAATCRSAPPTASSTPQSDGSVRARATSTRTSAPSSSCPTAHPRRRRSPSASGTSPAPGSPISGCRAGCFASSARARPWRRRSRPAAGQPGVGEAAAERLPYQAQNPIDHGHERREPEPAQGPRQPPGRGDVAEQADRLPDRASTVLRSAR